MPEPTIEQLKEALRVAEEVFWHISNISPIPDYKAGLERAYQYTDEALSKIKPVLDLIKEEG